VTVVYSGAITRAELQEATIAAARLGRNHDVTRYLADGTAVTSQPRELDFFVLPATLYDQLGLERHDLQIGVVVPPSGDLRDMVSFYQTACLNRGWNVKVFDAVEPAVAWLGVGSGAV